MNIIIVLLVAVLICLLILIGFAIVAYKKQNDDKSIIIGMVFHIIYYLNFIPFLCQRKMWLTNS
jgi:membrane protein YdbS with pleckstrin-like domain